MKKRISLILCVIFIFTMAVPLQVFGAGIDTGLENAIKIAKSLFEIPASYKFDSSINSESGKNVFSLNWRSSGSDYSYIMVRIDDKGAVLSYENYKPSDYTQSRKLPKVSRQEAKLNALDFIKKVNPGIVDQIRYNENNLNNNLMDSIYYFNFYRIVNSIPFYNDTVGVNVNRETGAVQSFYTTWTEGLDFPAPGKQITMDQAKDAFKKNLGLKLIYKYSYSYSEDKLKIYLVYTPRYENEAYAIDAFTGEKIKVGNGYYGPYYGMGGQEKAMIARASGDSSQVVLTPDEQKAVQDAAGLKTVQEAEKIARDAKFLELTDDFKLTNYNLNPSWPVKTDYIWYLSFSKTSSGGTSSDYTSVSVDAKTGVIISFYRGTPYQDGTDAKYSLKDSKAAVDAFIKENYPDIFSQIAYDSDYEDNFLSGMGNMVPRSYSFKYNRLVNGIEFPDNGITADYDAVSGKIMSFNLNWFNLKFPDQSNVLALDAAYDKLFNSIGLELQYKTYFTDNVYSGASVSPILPEIKLAYALKPGKPLFLDANSGAILDYEGNPYIEPKAVTYNDIKGSFAEEQIKVLAENGVYLDGSEFKPKAEIIQKDFFIMLSKTLYYYGSALTSSSTQKEIDDLYNYLEREGIVKSGEKAPEAAITREEAVKFLIRALKYDKVAEIKGIFISSFKDQSGASQELSGYITIAAGLKIVAGYKGNFYPKAKLTREAAAMMIYNYLQV